MLSKTPIGSRNTVTSDLLNISPSLNTPWQSEVMPRPVVIVLRTTCTHINTCIALTVVCCISNYCLFLEGNVRLVGGHVSHEGRVEVYHNSQWATVCDNNWDLQDAHVVCRQLGFPEALTATTRAFFGGGDLSQAILTSMSCLGSENELRECSYSSDNPFSFCGHNDDAGVVCSDGIDVEGELRLAGGPTPREGRVEIYHGGEWGTVCDDLSWLRNDAVVACRQLGFDGVTLALAGSAEGLDERTNHLSDIACTGYEFRIEDCSHSSWGSTCSSGRAAKIQCSGGPYAEEYDVRLVDGPSPQAGRVEIFHENSWGTICDNTWSSTEAKVVCDQLGYDDVDVVLEYFGAGDGVIHVSSLSCGGYEYTLANCLYVNFGSTVCDHTEDVGVRCKFDSDGYSGLSTWAIVAIVLSLLVVFSFVVSCVAVLIGKMTRPRHPTAGVAAFTVSGTVYPNGATTTAPSVTLNPANPQIPIHPQPAAGYPQVVGYPQAAGYPQSGSYPQSASLTQPPPNYDSMVDPAADGEKAPIDN
ncbi:CD5 antigen-like [Diadema setosum]|uniref:CD5 antigen-like n=1 Tax=Diadema setosum TaxID=31175 RepID=UPI003B3AA8D0